MVDLLPWLFMFLKAKLAARVPPETISLRTRARSAKKQNLKVGSSRTAGRLTFVHAATKVSKNAFLLAEGIFFAGSL
jgi:hypothetical protein